MFDVFSQKNRILLRELIKTDFKLRYQGSAIGYLWSILKPLMTFTIMYIVFIRFLRLGGDVPHYDAIIGVSNLDKRLHSTSGQQYVDDGQRRHQTAGR